MTGPASQRWTKRPEGSTWGDWGDDDELGRINLLTPEKVLQGVAEVRAGTGGVGPGGDLAVSTGLRFEAMEVLCAYLGLKLIKRTKKDGDSWQLYQRTKRAPK